MAVSTPGYINFASSGTCDVSFPELSVTETSFDCKNGTTAFVTITVTGGFTPYTWTVSKGVTSVVSTTQIKVFPAANTGHAVSGNGYGRSAHYCDLFTDCICQLRGCNDQITKACNDIGCDPCAIATGTGPCACAVCAGCNGLSFKESGSHASCCAGKPSCSTSNCIGCLNSYGSTCDLRSAGQISGGCNPCFLSMSGGVTITVTDLLGNSAFVHVDTTLSN